jgi:hypothetical protein
MSFQAKPGEVSSCLFGHTEMAFVCLFKPLDLKRYGFKANLPVVRIKGMHVVKEKSTI